MNSSGAVDQIATYRFEAAPSRARRIVRDGDVIISTVRTYLQAIAPITNPPENLIVSTGFAVIRPRPDMMDAKFCRYVLREPTFLAEVEKRSTGISYPAINASEIGDIAIPLPPISAQKLIADHVEAETAEIDALISAKQKLLDLMAEKRRAMVAEAVMRGLDPSAPLRPSGIDWLGDIPAHWEIERSRWLFTERDQRSQTGEEEMLTVSHLTGVTPRSEKDVNMFEAESTAGYKLCFAGDLAINTLWAWMGAMGTARVDGIVSPAYNVYTPGPRLLPDYVDALVRIPVFAQEVTRYSKGVWSSRLRLYPEGFFETWWPVPPLQEQQQIVEHISAETARIDRLRTATENSIALLKERRAALIAAAVTGQLEIPEAA
ncbi:MAG: restriction endonuclease subunit S [Alphaproteobacteria bacterium HGW-Alphaproteobacteria-1]|nr:MAG: restriction endonuclease subunit S [Alphaproteobacteria bacterium HGW-Alphaproteobacteria-1]